MRFRRRRTMFAACLAAGMLAGCSDQDGIERAPEIRPVIAMRLGDIGALAERTFPGRASAAQEVNLSFRVSGPLVELPARVGDTVKAGQEMARIDPRDFEVKIETIRGKLEQAKATLTVAESEYERALGVADKGKGLISASELDKRLGARDAARANVSSLRSALTSAENDLAYTRLVAPFDGVIVATYVENFEDVLAKQPILRLLDPTRIKMVISVPETLIGFAPYVEDALVTFDALPGVQVAAGIEEIGREASQATRTYPVTLLMEQPEGAEILPGMAGRASIRSRPPEDSGLVGMTIPATALFPSPDPDSSSVWVVDADAKTLSRRTVEIANLAQFGVLIRSGLEPGEWIVVRGVNSVREGQQVRIIDVTAEDRTP